MICYQRGIRPFTKILLLATCSMLALTAAARADSTTDIGIVQATTPSGSEAQNSASATYQAPSRTPLSSTQPTSVVTRHYIENNIPPSANYDNIATITPSVSNIEPNGPGLMESMGFQIRGFQDGQYNVTFDGIPWGDSNDFTHHTTSYFMAHDIGQISVNRGPGTAATVGDSTFGGTVALLSKNPRSLMTIEPYGSYGSYNTALGGGQIDTGPIKSLNGGTMFIDAEHLGSDGRLSFAGLDRTEGFMKIEVPLNDHTVITGVGMYNTLHQNVPVGSDPSTGQGYDFALNNDPTSQAFYKYNYDNINTDFEYIGLNSNWGEGWAIDSKIYTYGYFHHGYNGDDPWGTTPNNTFAGTGGCAAGTPVSSNPFATTTTTCDPNAVPAQKMKMTYRSFGQITRLKKNVFFGSVEAGVWYDHQWNSRYQFEIDQNLGESAYIVGAGKTGAVDRLMHDTLDTLQPYFEIHWNALPGLVLTPGVKYAYFRRGLDATVNQGSATGPLSYAQTWQEPLPSFDAHYTVMPHWIAYGQVAEGFLAPNLNTFYVANPGNNSFSPEKTWNYQVGTSYQNDWLSVSGDVYLIDFQNYITHKTVPIIGKEYFNAGGATYKGVELEGTYHFGAGLSFYANGSLNSARYSNGGGDIANAPRVTAAFGPIYNKNNVYGALLTKYVGPTWGQDQPDMFRLNGYMITNLALGYTLNTNPYLKTQGIKLTLLINNIFNKHGYNGLAGTDANGNPLYWTIPGTNAFFTVSAPF